MTEPKKLSEQELAAIWQWSEADALFGIDDLAEIHVRQLRGHIAALEADIAALAGDSIRQGEATGKFIEAQSARIQELEDAIRWVIYGVRGIDSPCEKWVLGKLSSVLPGFDPIDAEASNTNGRD